MEKTGTIQRGQLGRWEIQSFTDASKMYVVSQYLDDIWKCSCKHWIYRCRKLGKDCKHIDYVKEALIAKPILNPVKYAIPEHRAVQASMPNDDLCVVIHGYSIRRVA